MGREDSADLSRTVRSFRRWLIVCSYFWLWAVADHPEIQAGRAMNRVMVVVQEAHLRLWTRLLRLHMGMGKSLQAIQVSYHPCCEGEDKPHSYQSRLRLRQRLTFRRKMTRSDCSNIPVRLDGTSPQKQ